MINSNYEIVSASISDDGKVVYSIFREEITIDSDSAFTYGIAASDIHNINHVRDISTDILIAERIRDMLIKKSIKPENVFSFIQINFSEI